MPFRLPTEEEEDQIKAVVDWLLDPTDDDPGQEVVERIRQTLDDEVDAERVKQKRRRDKRHAL